MISTVNLFPRRWHGLDMLCLGLILAHTMDFVRSLHLLLWSHAFMVIFYSCVQDEDVFLTIWV